MGLNISPSIWQSYTNAILDCLQSRKYCRAIIDDLLLFTPLKKFHTAKLEDLLKALLKNGHLRFHQRNVSCLEKNYNIWTIQSVMKTSRVCIKPLRSRSDAIQKLRSFTGMVNFLSIFCPELQKLLKHKYDLTRKGRQFMWGEEQQIAFKEMKCRLVELLVLHLPDSKRTFHLYSDTSKFVPGSALYQIQNGKPKFIAYASKDYPKQQEITSLQNKRCVSY